jgi:hypothetical protein
LSSDGLRDFVKLNILQSIVLLLISMQSNQENRNKEKNKAIDSIVSKREKIHQKMQLWSNAYALRLTIANSDDDYDKLEDTFVTRTDANARYTHIVAESDYLEDFKDGSEYTLRHLIERYKEALQQQPKEEYLKKNQPLTSATYPSSSNEKIAQEKEEAKIIQRRRDYPIKIISYLKCHYCNLDFHNVKERKEHELEWHI